MPTETMLIDNGLTYAKAFEILETSNLTQVEINSLVWGILGETLGKSKRVFSYSKTFSATAPACVPSFARSFVHTDWIDGESVVQAEENSIEEGFNSRFHNIEDDLDALSADVGKAFGCLGEVRSELSARLTEIRTEINKINSDIHECCNKTGGGGGGFVPIDPGFYYPQPYPMPHPGWGGGGGWGGPTPLPGGPWIYEVPGLIGTGNLYGGPAVNPWTTPVTLETLLKGVGTTTYPGPAVTRSTSDPTRGTIGGMPGRRLDIKMFNGQPFEVWSTTGGIVMTPAPAGMKVEDQLERTWENPRAKAAGDVAAWVADKGRGLQEVFANGTSVGAIVDKFGDERLDGGTTLRDVLSVLPSATALAKPTDLIAMVADRAAMGVARDGMAAETLVANIGFNSQFKEVAEVPISDFKAVPVAARKALAAAGIRTVGALAKAQPDRVAQQLTAAGLRTSPSEAGRWTGEAMVMGKLGAPIRR